jgi:predicted lipid-binding transport protein (Tim44 family)
MGGLPIDLILFAMVAAFLVLRLRSVLGRRTGFERPPQPEAAAVPARGPATEVEIAAKPSSQGNARRVIPDPRSPVGEALMEIQKRDRSFDPNRFLDGAETAFGMIVEAFARGDRATLKPLLSEEAFVGFDQAITAREAAGETQRTELRNVEESGIEAAELRGSVAEITVRLVTDQINLVQARDGSIVSGAEAVTEMTDVWTFQRDLNTADPIWRLVGSTAA